MCFARGIIKNKSIMLEINWIVWPIQWLLSSGQLTPTHRSDLRSVKRGLFNYQRASAYIPVMYGNREYRGIWQKKSQGKSEGFDSCDRPSNFTHIRFKSLIFHPIWPRNYMVTWKTNKAPLLGYIQLDALFQSHQWIQTWIRIWKRSSQVKIGNCLVPCDLKIWRITLINNRAPLPMLLQALCIIS